MQIKSFFDANTATVTYIVSDTSSRYCAIIDSVLDYDPFSGIISTKSADQVIDYIKENNLTVQWILETHIHADHFTAASYLQDKLGGKIGIGSRIIDVLTYWVPVFNTADDTPLDGSQFDHLFKDNEVFEIGTLKVKVIHTPGHTPACVSYKINDAVFVGDMLFMPYVGTGRTDFPGGSAENMYESLQKVLSLPENTNIFTGHDYPPEGKPASWQSTIKEEITNNIMINNHISASDFITKRKQKDTNKPVPKLLYPAIQVNMRAGKLGQTESNGKQYIKIPISF